MDCEAAEAGEWIVQAARNRQSGFITFKLQTIVIMGVVALLGLVVVPVWVSRSAGPREVILATNLDTVAEVYALTLAEGGPGASLLTTPGPKTAAAFRASLRRPVVNHASHSSAVVSGDDWTSAGAAPGVWITSRREASPAEPAGNQHIGAALAGTVIVYVGPDLEIDVYAVSLTEETSSRRCTLLAPDRRSRRLARLGRRARTPRPHEHVRFDAEVYVLKGNVRRRRPWQRMSSSLLDRSGALSGATSMPCAAR